MIVSESIKTLIAKNKDDNEILKLINDCLLSFFEYHYRIGRTETFSMLYGYHNMEKEDYQATHTDLGKSRSLSHKVVISNIGILNRLCVQNGIPLVYNGILSEERPHRVEIADAVLAYVQEIITNRIR